MSRLTAWLGLHGVEPRWLGVGLGLLALAVPTKRSRNRLGG
jgi:hypothetical protein